jgi:hypothetical protein
MYLNHLCSQSSTFATYLYCLPCPTSNNSALISNKTKSLAPRALTKDLPSVRVANISTRVAMSSRTVHSGTSLASNLGIPQTAYTRAAAKALTNGGSDSAGRMHIMRNAHWMHSPFPRVSFVWLLPRYGILIAESRRRSPGRATRSSRRKSRFHR